MSFLQGHHAAQAKRETSELRDHLKFDVLKRLNNLRVALL